MVQLIAADSQHARFVQERAQVLRSELLASCLPQQFTGSGGDEHADSALLVERAEFDEQIDALAGGRRIHPMERGEIRRRRHGRLLRVDARDECRRRILAASCWKIGVSPENIHIP
ncbi:MAG: hypothetical protein WDM88_10210 [Galbitalea sp.]